MIDKIIVFKISKFQLILAFCDRKCSFLTESSSINKNELSAKVKLNLMF